MITHNCKKKKNHPNLNIITTSNLEIKITVYGKTILQTTLGRKRWAVRAEGYQQSPFPHFIPLKFLQAHPRVEKVLGKGKEWKVFWKLQKSSENYESYGTPVSIIILPSLTALIKLLNQDCENSPESTLRNAIPKNTQTHTEDSVSHCPDIWKFRLAATNSSEAFTIPPGISGHLIQAPVHLGAWPHQLVWTRPPGRYQLRRSKWPQDEHTRQPALRTGKSTLTSVPSRRDTRQVITARASPAAGMCVAARWASRSRSFSACLRIERRPSVLRKKLNILSLRNQEKKGVSILPQSALRQMA